MHMSDQIPIGSKDLTCPFHRTRCDKVCHKCPLWVKVIGKNPNNGAEVERWHCSFTWLPMLLVENAKEVRQGAAATESFRNEMVRRADNASAEQHFRLRHANNGIQPPLLIDAQ